MPFSPPHAAGATGAAIADGTANATGTDARWAAVRARDARADGLFFYGVRTTGIYCRPSCGARRPRPENVSFHATREQAEREGLRPCKRCRPERPSLGDRHATQIARVCRLIEGSERPPPLNALAAHVGLSVFHTPRLFRAVTGVTPRAYAAAVRAGYNSSGRFYATSTAMLGMTPKQYRAGGADLDLRFGVATCSLGRLLVAATARGVCAIALGDDPHHLEADLRRRFPRARMLAADSAFERLLAKVVRVVERPGATAPTLPLDIRGTAFQLRVWQALAKIPAGRTATYAQIATAIGAPRAVRAVARACATNALAVAIPCHRVVRADGSPSGYRWGLDRKRALLARESVILGPFPR
ncbi:MAG: methylated-DNA--[protein]-cysteine S-methyltransferase [Pseudomonadota bacterium]